MGPDMTPADLPLDVGGPHSVQAWEKATAAVLRKSGRLSASAPDEDVWAVLTTQTLDGIDVAPLGTSALLVDVPDPGLPGQAPYTRGTTAVRDQGAWDIRAQFLDPDAGTTAEHLLTDLENGVTSVWLRVGPGAIDVADLPAVLAQVYLDLAPVVLDAPEDPVGAARALEAILTERSLTPAPGTNLGANPIGSPDAAAAVAGVADIARRLDTRALVVDGTDVHDRGASDVQELAYTLAVGAAYLRLLAEAGHDVDAAAGLLEFRYAATDEQFPTIAKLRAARRLWHRVTELSGATPEARGQVQHAVTSRPMMTRHDAYVNLLRTTVASFAAGVGGADAVTVLPFDEALGLPEHFSRRIARNTSSVLISESHVAKVIDPAGGAYAVEKLTDDLARAAWDAFGQIEAAGGIAAVLADGSLHAQIAETVERRAAAIANRTRPITGVSEFPNLAEQLPQRRPYAAEPDVLRYAAPFEELRATPPQRPVFLATMGPIAAHTARATFVTNLLAAGGVTATPARATSSVDDVLAAYDGSPVVVLAGTDATYAEWGVELTAALRAAGATWVVLTGPPVPGINADDIATAGLDALAFLHRTRAQLAPTTGVTA